jgi:hypothetical protein
MRYSQVVCVFVLVITLCSCATAITGLNNAPDLSYIARGTLTETANCVNLFMTQNNDLNYPFYLRIVEIDRIYESHPGREIMLGGEPVFVRITAINGEKQSRGVLVRNFNECSRAADSAREAEVRVALLLFRLQKEKAGAQQSSRPIADRGLIRISFSFGGMIKEGVYAGHVEVFDITLREHILCNRESEKLDAD